MMPELTKDTRKTLKAIYDAYRKRRKDGKSKQDAAEFNSEEAEQFTGFNDARDELRAAGFTKENVLGDVILTDKAIIFMESFSESALMKWVEVGTKLIEFGTQFIP